jgi:hypothetical protein
VQGGAEEKNADSNCIISHLALLQHAALQNKKIKMT